MALRWPGLGIAQEQPVLFAQGGGSNGFFHEVVVDLNSAVFKIDAKQRPIGERIIDGLGSSGSSVMSRKRDCIV